MTVNEDEEIVEHTVTIKDYRSGLLDHVAISATSKGEATDITNDGKITVADKADLVLTITTKGNVKIASVKSGDTALSGTGPYTLSSVEADAEIEIAFVEYYTVTLAGDNTVTLKRLVKDAEGKETQSDLETDAEIDKGEDLKFIASEAAPGTTLSVSYAVDGEVMGAVPSAEEDDPASKEDPKEKRTVYTISKTELADADALTITLKVNEGKAVSFTVNKGVYNAETSNVTVQVWGDKTGEDRKTTQDWIAVPAEYKVIAGQEANFKATAKDPYAITKVMVGTKEIPVSADGVYKVEITSDTTVDFTTDFDASKSKVLTFNLAGDEGSATAKIKGVTLNKTGEEAEDKVLNSTELTEFFTSVGLTGGVLTAGADNAVKIPNTVKEITVEVTAKENDYKLSKINDTAVKTGDAEDETAKAERTIAYANIGELKVETAAVESDADTYFTIDPNKYVASTNETGVRHITLDVGAGTGNSATVTAVEDTPNTYKVKSGTATVSITMTAEEGWALADTFEDGLTPEKGVAGVAKEVKDKKTVYTVKLLARKLGAQNNPTSLGTIAEAIQTFTAEVDEEASSEEGYVEGEYTVTPDEAYPAEGADKDNIPYNAKLETTITAARGYSLQSVTVTMGGTALPAIEVLNNAADIEIAYVTGDVKIKVETAPAYTLSLAAVAVTDAPDVDEDDIYSVKYNGKYKINVTPAVVIDDLSAEIKDGSTVVGRGRRISGELQLWMNKALAGKELVVDVKAKDVSIGELVLQVNKQRSTLSVKDGSAIKQDVASTAVYEIETDGDKLPVEDTEIVVSGDLSSKVDAVINEDGNLEVTVDPAKFTDVNDVVETGAGEDKERTVTPKKATILITDPEDSTLKARAVVTANAIFDTISQPSVSLVNGGASDTVLNVNVSMDGVIAPKDDTSKVFYVITAEAEADKAATDTEPASNRDSKLKETTTKVVERKGGSQRVELNVAATDDVKLGDGAEWKYKVSAVAVYALDGSEPSESTMAKDVTADGSTDVSALSKEEEMSTITPLFESALKLKKDSKKKPASTLYTGQENLYIATPEWSKKNVNYKITEAEVVDLTGYGLDAEIDDAGDLVVTSVDTEASLGKHTLQVTAKADETTGHTMYASRATINVTVVKGINSLNVYTPGNQIYKQTGKAATYKVTPGYETYWNGKKTVDAPKTKKVTWKIVGADSYIGEDNEDGTYNGSIDDLKEANAPAGITIKNGTVTVAKDFAIDARHPKNNQFRVLVQAADFAGNKTAALSNVVTITNEALDVTNLVIAKYDYEKSGYNVIAVKEGTKSNKAVDVKAEDIDGASVYATAKSVSEGFVSDAKWDTLGVVDYYNLTYTPAPGKNKVLTVDEYGDIEVLASGKKATIAVTTTDGAKKKNSLALNLGYKDADSTAAMQITAADVTNTKTDLVTNAPTKEDDAAAKVEKDYTIPGVAKLNVNIFVAQRNDQGAFQRFIRADGYMNYKLTVKGGKFVDNGYGYVTVYTTSKVTTLNLTVGAGKTAKKYTYVLTNLAYNETVKPKVTPKNSLHTSGTEDEQKVTMTALNGKESFGDNKYAKVELDKTAWPKYGTAQYGAWYDFEDAIKENYIKLNKDTGEFDLEFNANNNDRSLVNLTAGTYKLKVTVGDGATAGAFKATTQPVTVSVKVVKNKAFTFKPTTTYTINKVDGAAVLTGKSNVSAKAGELTGMSFYRLQNMNVNGKSNNFTHYFKLDKDSTGADILTLNTSDLMVQKLLYETKEDGTVDTTKPIELDLTKIKAPDLTGYVSYDAWSNVKYYTGNRTSGTVKITVKMVADPKNGKFKASQKYTPQGGTEIKPKKDQETQVNILTSGRYVSVAHAIIDDSKAKSNAPELSCVGTNAKGQIVLKAAADLDTARKGGYSVNLLIVPTTSYYAAQIAGETKAEDKKALIEKYGISVKVTVVANENAKTTPDPSELTYGTVEEPEPEEPVAPVVTIVTVTPTSANISVDGTNGGTATFTATVEDQNGDTMSDQTINWTLTGTVVDSSKTKLDKETGDEVTLTVDKDQTTATLTLKATCGDVNSDEITITITNTSDGAGS